MSKKNSSLILDLDYSRAFLSAALDDGKAKISDPQAFKDFSIKGDLGRALLEYKATNRLKGKALEMAVIFDTVDLFGIPPLIDIEDLEKEGLVRTSFRLGAGSIKGHSEVPHVFVRHARGWLLRTALRRSNTVLSHADLPPVPYRAVSRAFDAIELACLLNARQNTTLIRSDLLEYVRSADSKIGFIDIHKLKHMLARLKIEGQPLDSISHNYLEIIVEMYRMMSTVDTVDSTRATICLFEVMAEIETAWTLCMMSIAFSTPFLSNNISLPARANIQTAAGDIHDTLSLCRVALKEEVKYAPRVDSIEDVLRMRGHTSIARFRELIYEWCEQLSSGEATTLAKMKSDIRKANKELRKLDKWKTVDHWLFWVQLPATLIPILSTVVTVASFATHLWVDRDEKINSWIAIGR